MARAQALHPALGAVVGTVLAMAVCGCGRSTPATETGASHGTTTNLATGARDFRGRPALGASSGEDFALRDQSDEVVRLSAQRGRFVLLTFLYTSCPDVCPLIASNLDAAVRALPPEQRLQVQVIAVSVDPRRDTRPVVRAYVREHHLLPQFRFLIGSRAELQPIWQAYNVLVDKRNDQVISHSTFVLLLDRSGKPRLYYSSQVRAVDVLHDLLQLMSKT